MSMPMRCRMRFLLKDINYMQNNLDMSYFNEMKSRVYPIQNVQERPWGFQFMYYASEGYIQSVIIIIRQYVP